jgi:hypothetical protein
MQKSARARLSDVMSTPEKSTLPSAPLRSHRNFEFSFWNYMSTMLMWTIQNSVARARLSSVWSTIERSTRPSAPLKSHRNFEFSFWEYMSPILALTMQNSVARARASEFCIVHNRMRRCGRMQVCARATATGRGTDRCMDGRHRRSKAEGATAPGLGQTDQQRLRRRIGPTAPGGVCADRWMCRAGQAKPTARRRTFFENKPERRSRHGRTPIIGY